MTVILATGRWRQEGQDLNAILGKRANWRQAVTCDTQDSDFQKRRKERGKRGGRVGGVTEGAGDIIQ